MNQLALDFSYSGIQIRTSTEGEIIWFVLKDVCDALGIANSRNVYARLDDDEKGVCLMDTLGGKQLLQMVNEPGLHNVILRSDSERAKPFRRWVTHEVLPSIRKKGYYSCMSDADLLRIVATQCMDRPSVLPRLTKGYINDLVKMQLRDEKIEARDIMNKYNWRVGPIYKEMVSNPGNNDCCERLKALTFDTQREIDEKCPHVGVRVHECKTVKV